LSLAECRRADTPAEERRLARLRALDWLRPVD